MLFMLWIGTNPLPWSMMGPQYKDGHNEEFGK